MWLSRDLGDGDDWGSLGLEANRSRGTETRRSRSTMPQHLTRAPSDRDAADVRNSSTKSLSICRAYRSWNQRGYKHRSRR
jgi:hypothetical protein